jgi:glycogen debranching enzyme
VLFDVSGSFFVQIVYEDERPGGGVAYSSPQYINVEPVMTANSRLIRGKELSLLTVMSRCLGKMSRWPAVLRNVRELGYNAVHFAPFQAYGESYSHYSLADQTTVDDQYFEAPASMSRRQRLAELKGTLDGLRSEGLLSMVDIVLNHTANDSKWIVDHPEATYNTDDCPHLWAAWELDSALQ